jgi:hypothetical protein
VRTSLPSVGRAHHTKVGYNFLRARRTGFSHRVGVFSVYLALALCSAPPRCPKPSFALTSAVLMLCLPPQTAEDKLQAPDLAGVPGPIGAGLC